jgi:hypothetical protein
MAADANFNYPTEYKFKSIDIIIDNKPLSIRPMFFGLDIFENIFMGGITGSVTIVDTDTNGFIEKHDIEFIEDFTFEIENVMGDTLKFEGHLNGVRNESIKQQKRVIVIDFNSKATRLNEGNFVTKRFKNVKPHDIAKEMAERLETEIDESSVQDEGRFMNFLGSRKKPLDIMKYVLKHGVPIGTSKSTETDNVKSESSGTSGYLFWETLDGIRFSSIDKLLEGSQYKNHTEFKYQTSQKSLPMDVAFKGIIEYNFPQLGDYQSKLRHGAYKSKFINLDWNTGEVKEHTYEAKAGEGTKDGSTTTEKQLEKVTNITRVFYRIYDNDRMEPGCEKAAANKYDQSRLSIQQGASRMNSFSDQHGRVTLPPQFHIRSGDTINLNITKTSSSDALGETNKKHSGKYVVKQISHHIHADGKAYSQISTIRSVTQQDDASSE